MAFYIFAQVDHLRVNCPVDFGMSQKRSPSDKLTLFQCIRSEYTAIELIKEVVLVSVALDQANDMQPNYISIQRP